MRSGRILLAAFLSAAAWGCGPEMRLAGHDPPPPVPNPNVLRLMTPMLSAVSTDEVPGPEGLRVRAFFKLLDGRKDEQKMVTVSGSLKFLMFDGKVAGRDVADIKPYHVWNFSSGQLDGHLVRTRYGWGYDFLLLWGRRVPRKGTVTVVAAYEGPTDRTLYSRPIHIVIGPA